MCHCGAKKTSDRKMKEKSDKSMNFGQSGQVWTSLDRFKQF